LVKRSGLEDGSIHLPCRLRVYGKRNAKKG